MMAALPRAQAPGTRLPVQLGRHLPARRLRDAGGGAAAGGLPGGQDLAARGDGIRRLLHAGIRRAGRRSAAAAPAWRCATSAGWRSWSWTTASSPGSGCCRKAGWTRWRPRASRCRSPARPASHHYGYCWWLGDGLMSAVGFAGQRIDILRDEGLAMVTLGAFPQPPHVALEQDGRTARRWWTSSARCANRWPEAGAGETGGMRAIIIGGGIGGLTTALALHARGHRGRRSSRAPREVRPLGVGINLQPHAVRELTELGLARRWPRPASRRRNCATPTASARRSGPSRAACAAGYRWPQYSIHRGRLQVLLWRAARGAARRRRASRPASGWSASRRMPPASPRSFADGERRRGATC